MEEGEEGSAAGRGRSNGASSRLPARPPTDAEAPPPLPFKRRAPLGERAHELRVVADERGVDALRLEELAHELVQQAARRLRRRALHAVLRAELDEAGARLLRLERLRQLDVERLLEARDHRDAAPAGCREGTREGGGAGGGVGGGTKGAVT